MELKLGILPPFLDVPRAVEYVRNRLANGAGAGFSHGPGSETVECCCHVQRSNPLRNMAIRQAAEASQDFPGETGWNSVLGTLG